MNLFELPDLVYLDYVDHSDIIERVCMFYGVEFEQIKHTRRVPYVWYRQVLTWVLVRNGVPFVEIALIFNQDRTSVYHSLKVVENQTSIYKKKEEELKTLMKII